MYHYSYVSESYTTDYQKYKGVEYLFNICFNETWAALEHYRSAFKTTEKKKCHYFNSGALEDIYMLSEWLQRREREKIRSLEMVNARKKYDNVTNVCIEHTQTNE